MALPALNRRGLPSLCKQLQTLCLTGNVQRPVLQQAFAGAAEVPSERYAQSLQTNDEAASVSGRHVPINAGCQHLGGCSWLGSFEGVLGDQTTVLSKLQLWEGRSVGVLSEISGARGYATKLWKFTRKRLYGAPLAFLDPEKHPLDQPVPTSSPNEGSIKARGRNQRRRMQQRLAFKAWSKMKMEEAVKVGKSRLQSSRIASQRAAAERHRLQLRKAAE